MDFTICTSTHSTPPGAGMASLAVSCAWCLTEQGRPLLASESHGICQKHAGQLLENWRSKKAGGNAKPRALS